MPLFKKRPSQSSRGDKEYRRRSMNSYYRSSNEGSSASPFKRKARKSNPRKLLFGAADIILVVLLLAGLVYSLILKPQPKIKASDFSYHSAEVYKAGIQPFFSNVKDRNKISFDEAAAANAIEAKYPEVQSVRVELPFFNPEPIVRLNISKPEFKFDSGGKAYIVDSKGIVVAETKDIPRLKGLTSLNDLSGYQVRIGQPALSSSSVAFINTVIAQAKKANVPISQLSLPPLAQEMDLRTQDQPYYVKFYMGGDALSQSGQFLAARQKFAKGQSPPAQYLDVRVSGKVFYK